jgi:hypothetical protein
MSCFDINADNTFETNKNWLWQLSHSRRGVANNDALTNKRTQFIKQHGITEGNAKKLTCPPSGGFPSALNLAARSAEDALLGYPTYSARLVLEFELKTPLLTKDDDPFYLFDNPARKDHVFQRPFLSAASIKGLSVDAYQRALPNSALNNNKDEAERTRAFRRADDTALRLFGVCDDGSNIDDSAQAGRLRFSPLWFKNIQYLVINKRDEKTACGGGPIQFEAVAPQDKVTLEVIYFNPAGTKDSDENSVRNDLFCWLNSVRLWWPALGLGAKRLAGYGAIEPLSATLHALDWSGMAVKTNHQEEKNKALEAVPQIPKNYETYVKNGQLMAKDDFQTLRDSAFAEKEEEILRLSQKLKTLKGKDCKKQNKKLTKAKNQQHSQGSQLDAEYRQAGEYLAQQAETITQHADKPSLSTLRCSPQKKDFRGGDSWEKLAAWINPHE